MGTIFTVSLYCSEEQMQFPAELRLSEHMGPIVTVPLHCCEEEMQFHKAQHTTNLLYIQILLTNAHTITVKSPL